MKNNSNPSKMLNEETQRIQVGSLGVSEPQTSLDRALQCAKVALEKRGENVRILDLGKLSSFTDYFVICSGVSTRQLQSIAEAIEGTIKKGGGGFVSSEGQTEGRWILLDFGDVVVHLFLDALRDYYDIEGFWSDAPRVKIPASFYGQAASLGFSDSSFN